MGGNHTLSTTIALTYRSSHQYKYTEMAGTACEIGNPGRYNMQLGGKMWKVTIRGSKVVATLSIAHIDRKLHSGEARLLLHSVLHI